MIVGDLLRLEDLNLGLAWGSADLLDRRVTGVTTTDLQDPARYLQPGELVLSGLVWWKPDLDEQGRAASAEAALRFATSLRSAGVAALLAGEGTHGEVPSNLVDACRIHGIPLLSIPAGTSFRAVTDRIYLRLWGEINAGSPQVAALPEGIRQELTGMLEAGSAPARVLARAVARLGLPHCAVVSAGGRVIAASDAGQEAAGPEGGVEADAGPGELRLPPHGGTPVGPPGASPFDGWRLTPGVGPVPRALADLLAPLAAAARSTDAQRRTTTAQLFDLLAASGRVGQDDLADALGACGLPADASLTTVSARIDRAPTVWAVDALTEILQLAGAGFTAGTDDRGEATALVAGHPGELRRFLPGLQSLLGANQVLRIGVGPVAVPTVQALRGSLVGARYALASATPFADAAGTDSLAALLAGIPEQVTTAFHDRLLAPLLANDRENSVSLLDTLATFLDHDGSWARTAKALHVHVNTVHYRARRIEELTGRDLARLADQIDLRAALLCAPGGSVG